MNVNEFNEEQWRDVFAEFRLLVISAGYADWDKAMYESLAEMDEDLVAEKVDRLARPAVDDLRRYVSAFMRYLKVRSRNVLESRRHQLRGLLSSESGSPIESVLVEVEGLERPLFGDEDDPDAMILDLGRFLAELNGEASGFWEGQVDLPEGDA